MKPLFVYPPTQKFVPEAAGQQPQRPLIILGEAPLLGLSTGYLAIELGPASTKAGARLWTLYGENASLSSLRAYGRICSNAPEEDTPEEDALLFWINPRSQLTQVAGLGCDWLIPTKTRSHNGLERVEINTLMLQSEAFTTLGL